MHNYRKVWLQVALVLFAIFTAGSIIEGATQAHIFHLPLMQETIPAAPADRTLIYFADEKGALAPLAFEVATTPLNLEMVAKGDKRSYVELKGENSRSVITNFLPHFYVFLPDRIDAKPPFIVRLTDKRGARRVTAMAQKGYKGYAIDSAEIIKPHYRVLGRENGQIFMEIRPREPLMMGEYAIIGADLKLTATFRIRPASNQIEF